MGHAAYPPDRHAFGSQPEWRRPLAVPLADWSNRLRLLAGKTLLRRGDDRPLRPALDHLADRSAASVRDPSVQLGLEAIRAPEHLDRARGLTDDPGLQEVLVDLARQCDGLPPGWAVSAWADAPLRYVRHLAHHADRPELHSWLLRAASRAMQADRSRLAGLLAWLVHELHEPWPPVLLEALRRWLVAPEPRDGPHWHTDGEDVRGGEGVLLSLCVDHAGSSPEGWLADGARRLWALCNERRKQGLRGASERATMYERGIPLPPSLQRRDGLRRDVGPAECVRFLQTTGARDVLDSAMSAGNDHRGWELEDWWLDEAGEEELLEALEGDDLLAQIAGERLIARGGQAVVDRLTRICTEAPFWLEGSRTEAGGGTSPCWRRPRARPS